jgi:hypothetical protein
VNGQRRFVTNMVNLNVLEMPATSKLPKKHYNGARTSAKAEIAGLGDKACIDETNQIFIRKRLLNIKVHADGDARDRILWNDATRRVNARPKLAAQKLPFQPGKIAGLCAVGNGSHYRETSHSCPGRDFGVRT